MIQAELAFAPPVGGRVVHVEQGPAGLWSWSCEIDGACTGPWSGYASEALARAAAGCWYPLPDRTGA